MAWRSIGARPPAIGRPIAGIAAYVVDGRLEPAPAGVAGELLLGGAGLARGYLGEAGATAERFLPDPFGGRPGGRLYRTGDRVRHLPEGDLEFLGRIDDQVKIRGFRVEPGEIESALRRHPAVREAAVALVDGPAGRQLAAYVACRPDEALSGAGEAAAEAAVEDAVAHLAQWRTLYDETYGQSDAADPTFDIGGWNSSYTGQPIPAEEMREWVERTVERIAALAPRRVLEIGCGTGLLLFRLAPRTASYLGTDFSRVALDGIRRRLSQPGVHLPQVALRQAAADDWRGIAPGAADLVVLNSVVQYFPGVDYLVRVLAGAIGAVRPGGAVFVGDVRDLTLLETFYASVELHRAAGSLPAAELARRVRRRTADEEELVIAPALFHALARRLPAVRRVQVLLKRGSHANELTRFRYDVVLHVGPRQPAPAAAPVEELRWPEALTLADLAARLARQAPGALAISGIPNARLAGDAIAVGLLADGAADRRSVDELRAEVERRRRERAAPAVDPEALWALADRLGYDADLAGSAIGRAAAAGGDEGGRFRFDAVLRRREAAGGAGAVEWTAPGTGAADLADLDRLPWSAWANDPLRALAARRRLPELRRFLASELPDYMIPASFVLLDALPLTPHGKVDRAALPAPGASGEPAESWVAPATPLEEMLARVTSDVLGLARAGMRDNFFALGGHSLLATQLVSRLAQNGVPATLRMIFDAADLGDLAGRLAALPGSGPQRIPRRPAGLDPVPASFAQERLWFLDRMTPGNPAYNIALALRIDGALAPATLQEVLGAVVRRHEALRTTFRELDGLPVQVIAPAGGWALPVIDLGGLGEPRRAGGRPRRARWPRARRRSAWRASWRAGRSTSSAGRCCAPSCCGSRRASTPCSSTCTTSSPTAGRWGCWCARSPPSMPRRGRGMGRSPRLCRSCRSSTPTSPSGSAAGSPARCSSGRSPTGGSGWPALRHRSTCRATGRARRCPPTAARICTPSSAPTSRAAWHGWRGGTGRASTWPSSPASRRSSAG